MTYNLPAAKASEMARAAFAHLDHALFRALRRHLGQNDLMLADVFNMRDRLACVELDGNSWYYVDGQCFYGVGPLKIQSHDGHDGTTLTLVASREELDPTAHKAPPCPVRVY